MANPFDQFDNQPLPPARQVPASNPFDQFDGAAPAPRAMIINDGSTEQVVPIPVASAAPAANNSNFARMITGQPRQEEGGILRDLGMSARSVLQGAGGLLGTLGGDAFNAIVVNPVARGIGMPEQQAPTYREAAGQLADALGLPAPQNSHERVLGDIGEALTGTGLTLGAGGLLNTGRQVASAAAPTAGQLLGDFLTAQPVLQSVSAATGAGASSATREAGGGTSAQLAAGLLGGLAPGAAATLTPMTIRGALRGGEGNRQALDQAIKDFEVLGSTPSVGQGTGAWSRQGAESLLAAGPTSAGVMGRFADRQSEQLGTGLQSLADQLFRNPSAERAGRAVEQGIRGDNGFIQTSREQANQLYRRLDDLIPSDSRVDVANVRQALSDLNAEIPGAPSLSQFFNNARLQGIERGLTSDTQGVDAVLSQPGMRENADLYRQYLTNQASEAAARNAERKALNMTNIEPVPTPEEIDASVRSTLSNMVDNHLPYEALQKLRTLVGNELENTSLVSDVPRSKWKAVYGALSKDMEAAATTPEAKQALSRANSYFNARASRIDAIDRIIDRNGGPEKIFSAVMGGAKDGGTTLRAVMQSLPEDGQKAVTAATIRRMGMANPGAQDAAGEAFSASTFLTNWNKVSPEARRALFDRYGPGFSADMDKVAKVAERIKDGSGVLANASGTVAKGAGLTYWGSLTGSILTGQVLGTGAIATSGLFANGAARAMTNPRIVKWLARNTQVPAGAFAAQLQMLRNIGRNANDPEVTAFADALEESQQQGGDTAEEYDQANRHP